MSVKIKREDGSEVVIKLRRVKTPTVLQMEAVECGAAALGIILSYYGLRIPLEELRVACGVSRDGSKASNLIKAARRYNLSGKGLSVELNDLYSIRFPAIIFWNFNHFIVLEGFQKRRVYVNDPASGPRTVSLEELDQSFTGVVLVFEPEVTFKKGGEKRSIVRALMSRLKGSWAGLAYLVFTGLALVTLGLVIPTFARVFVDEVLIKGRDWVRPLLIGMALAAILRAVFTWLQQLYLLRLETKLAVTTSSKFFRHVLSLPVEFFSQRYAGDLSSRVEINDKVAQLLSSQLATTALNAFLIILYALLMLQYDLLLTLVGVAITALNIVALHYVSRRRIDINQKLLQERGKLSSATFNGLQIIETLKATGSESEYFARWAGYQAKVLVAEQQLGLSSQYLLSVPTFLTAVNTAAILTIGSLRVMDGSMTLGMLVAFQSLMASFTSPVNQLVSLGSTLQEIEGDMNRLDDVLRYQPDLQAQWTPTSLSTAHGEAKLSGKLELKGVTFGYSRLDPPLIDNFSLLLESGQRVALVGISGSGKSTIAKLVAGLYEPWEGQILFDGVPLKAIPRSVLANSLAVVDQDIFLFEGSVHDNLTLWNTTISEPDVLQATKDAMIHTDITDRVGGYHSIIEEGGRNFSGGQRQRLEIARALISNPSLLVLDEATSALDPVTEKTIDDNLRRRGCSCLIIAHRLSTIRDCDEIIVLERGKVVQRGSHQELIKRDSPYTRLIKSEDYQADKSSLKSVLEML